MKNHTNLNKKHWEILPANAIIGRNAFPGEELFSHIPPQANILDLGCGTGEISELLATYDYNVTAIDINIDAISLNKSKSTRVKYILGDIMEPLPFSDQCFHAIVISFVLVSVISQQERQQLIYELIRILKPGGIIWVNEGLISSDYQKRYELSTELLQTHDHDFFVFDNDTPSSSIQTLAQLKQALDQGKVARIAHHFSVPELKELFTMCDVLYENKSATTSPNTKSTIEMVILVFKLKTV